MKKHLSSIWTWIGVVVTGAVGSIIASIIFEGRLPRWLLRPKEEVPAVELVIDWWRLGGIIGTVSAIAIIVILAIALRGPRVPVIADYTKDRFFGLAWRWRYYSDRSIEAVCFCPRCDRQLTVREVDRWPFVYAWECAAHGEMARKEGEFGAIIDDAVREIQLKLRNGQWKDVVERQWKAESEQS